MVKGVSWIYLGSFLEKRTLFWSNGYWCHQLGFTWVWYHCILLLLDADFLLKDHLEADLDRQVHQVCTQVKTSEPGLTHVLPSQMVRVSSTRVFAHSFLTLLLGKVTKCFLILVGWQAQNFDAFVSPLVRMHFLCTFWVHIFNPGVILCKIYYTNITVYNMLMLWIHPDTNGVFHVSKEMNKELVSILVHPLQNNTDIWAHPIFC